MNCGIRHTASCAAFMPVSIKSSRKYQEKHGWLQTPLLNMLELICQGPCSWKKGIVRITDHETEGCLLTKHPSEVQNQY